VSILRALVQLKEGQPRTCMPSKRALKAQRFVDHLLMAASMGAPAVHIWDRGAIRQEPRPVERKPAVLESDAVATQRSHGGNNQQRHLSILAVMVSGRPSMNRPSPAVMRQ
jgi:hypothetical protein